MMRIRPTLSTIATALIVFVCMTAGALVGLSKAADPHGPAQAAKVLPHDTHDGLTIQADPYTDKVRCKDKFGKADPYPVGILPVEVTLRNDSPNLIRVDINTIQLQVILRSGGHQDLDWLAAEDVAALIAHPAGAGAPSRPKIAGLPIPSGDKKVDKLAEILKPLTLDADTIAPKGSVHGFVYFNVNHDVTLSDSAVLYVPDAVILPSKKVLMFFEVALGPSDRK
ncbi:MAG TPA: hypothetical protein VGD60_06280 [Candidatus Acidoferrales bacterium]